MNLGQVRREAEPAMRAELGVYVDLAKAEALRLIGEQEQGYALGAARVEECLPGLELVMNLAPCGGEIAG